MKNFVIIMDEQMATASDNFADRIHNIHKYSYYVNEISLRDKQQDDHILCATPPAEYVFSKKEAIKILKGRVSHYPNYGNWTYKLYLQVI